jgi:MFS family permease
MNMSVGALPADSSETSATTEWPILSLPAKAALISNSVAGAIGFLGVGLILPLMAKHFASTHGAGLLTQLLGGVVGAALAVSSPLAGRVIDRVGYRTVYLFGALFFALFGTAPFLLDNLYVILACRIGVGVSMAAVLIGGYTGISTLAPALRAKMMGYSALVGGVSAVLLFPILGALGKIGWQYAFLPHLVTLLLIPLGLTLPHTQRKAAVAATVHAQGLGVPLSLLAIAVLGGMLSFIGPNFSAFYLASIGITDPARAAIPLTAMAFCSVLGSGLYGLLYTRAGGTLVFALALLLTGIGLVIASLSHGLAIFALGGGIAGIGCAFIAPNLSVTAMNVAAPSRVGHAVGLTTGAMFAAQVIVPFITEPLRQMAGAASVFTSFGIAALAVGFVYAVSAFMQRATRKPA